jgi:hypothetical protein
VPSRSGIVWNDPDRVGPRRIYSKVCSRPIAVRHIGENRDTYVRVQTGKTTTHVTGKVTTRILG